MSEFWAAIFLAATAPFCIVAMVTDLRQMIIPNEVSIGLVVIFLLLGPFAFGLEGFAFRAAILFIVFFIGFLIHDIGLMGGGDIKMMTALSPLMVQDSWFHALVFLSMITLIFLALRSVVRWIPPLFRRVQHWKSYQDLGNVPYGAPLGFSFIGYMYMIAVGSV